MSPTKAETAEFHQCLVEAAKEGNLQRRTDGYTLHRGPRNREMVDKVYTLLARHSSKDVLASFSGVRAKKARIREMLNRLLDGEGKLRHNNRQELVLLTS